jgi:hypothetical protein
MSFRRAGAPTSKSPGLARFAAALSPSRELTERIAPLRLRRNLSTFPPRARPIPPRLLLALRRRDGPVRLRLKPAIADPESPSLAL